MNDTGYMPVYARNFILTVLIVRYILIVSYETAKRKRIHRKENVFIARTFQELFCQQYMKENANESAQHSTAQHSTAQHSTAQHSTAQHSTAQHSTAQHSTAQHSTAQLYNITAVQA
jgi:hypothetical protein